MIIKLEKSERDLIVLMSEKNDLRKFKKTQKLIKNIKKNTYGFGYIININKEEVVDIYNIIINFQEQMNFDDINLIELEEKFKKFVDDIKNKRMGWDKE